MTIPTRSLEVWPARYGGNTDTMELDIIQNAQAVIFFYKTNITIF